MSAFYAENVQKRIQFSGHIWTKSQFHGLSIGVENIGNGKLGESSMIANQIDNDFRTLGS